MTFQYDEGIPFIKCKKCGYKAMGENLIKYFRELGDLCWYCGGIVK